MYTRYIVYTGREGCMTLIHCDTVCVCAVYPLFVLTWLGCVECARELRLRWGGIYARQTASLYGALCRRLVVCMSQLRHRF